MNKARNLMRTTKELGLYLHIPFCRSKCHYCDFNSYSNQGDLIPAYLEILKRESERYSRDASLRVKTIYIGGGTPTVLSGGDISDVLNTIRGCQTGSVCQAGSARYEIGKEAEITIEANPGTLDKFKLAEFKAAGINRLSLGLQAMDDSLLSRIGRRHQVKDGLNAYYSARQAGFDNINCDLLFGLPTQKLSDWERSLATVLDLEPEHLSLYCLTLDPGKQWKEDLSKNRPSEEEESAMYDLAIDYLADNGYEHYEISNFARPGYRSIHNQIYWRNEEYLGLGAGAWSYLDGRRYSNPSHPKAYIENGIKEEWPAADEESLSTRRTIGEAIMLGLRLVEGIKVAEFNNRFKTELENMFSLPIRRLERDGLLEINNGHLRLTRRGLHLADTVALEFI